MIEGNFPTLVISNAIRMIGMEQVLNRFAFSLFPNGHLMLGKTEALRPPQAQYEAANRVWNAYRCIGKAAPLPQFPDASAFQKSRLTSRGKHQPFRTPDTFNSSPVNHPILQSVPSLSFELGPLPRFNELLFRSLPIGMVGIDRNYHIITANSISRRLLRLPASTAEKDFLHSVPGVPYTMVRNAIDAALKERSTISLPEIEMDVIAGGNGRVVALSISPIQLDTAPPELVAISVIDVTEQVQTQRRLEALRAEQAQLVEELGAANARLQEVDAALVKANEDLQASNEDMIVSQEEFQAKLVELETSRSLNRL